MEQEKKNSETHGFKALRHHPKSLQTLLDSIYCGIFTTDRQGRITFTNNSARKMLGHSREELVGTLFEDLAWQTLDGTPLSREEHPLAQVLDNGEPVPEGNFSLVHDGGQRFFFAINAVPLLDRQGHLIGAAADLLDISERFRLQQERDQLTSALQESEARYRVLAEAAPVGVFESDEQGGVLYLNPHGVALYGHSREECLGLGWLRAVHPEDRGRVWDSCQRSADEPGIQQCEFRLLHPAGETIWVQVLRQALPADGEKRLVGIVEDITGRQRTLQALAQAKKCAEEASSAKSRFLSVVGHEIRTPMTIFMGMVELTLAGQLAAEQRRYLEAAQESAESLLSLIEDILIFSDLEAKRMILERHLFGVQPWVQEALDKIAAEAEAKGVALRVEISPEIPQQIIGDPKRLQQVLTNLVGNAVKFTEDGEIELRIELCHRCLSESSGVRFSVTDTGVGIPPEKMDQLFSPFGQLDDSSTRRLGGSGLGLVISKGLVEAMGGQIEVKSSGRGSTFAFIVPLEASRHL
ncbi:MAG: PAS domain S-box protein [Desulfuromonadales bacterium]|nr:PAS domain S-box protein [Desulfuromonadales bacterium]